MPASDIILYELLGAEKNCPENKCRMGKMVLVAEKRQGLNFQLSCHQPIDLFAPHTCQIQRGWPTRAFVTR